VGGKGRRNGYRRGRYMERGKRRGLYLTLATGPAPSSRSFVIGNESVPIQLAQYRFPGLAVNNAKI